MCLRSCPRPAGYRSSTPHDPSPRASARAVKPLLVDKGSPAPPCRHWPTRPTDLVDIAPQAEANTVDALHPASAHRPDKVHPCGGSRPAATFLVRFPQIGPTRSTSQGHAGQAMADRPPLARLGVLPLVDTPSRDEPDRVVSVLVDFTSGLSRPPSQCTPTLRVNGYRPSQALAAPTNLGLPAHGMSTTESWTSRITPRPRTSTMLPAPAQCLTTTCLAPARAQRRQPRSRPASSGRQAAPAASVPRHPSRRVGSSLATPRHASPRRQAPRRQARIHLGSPLLAVLTRRPASHQRCRHGCPRAVRALVG